ncbi:MAG: hypothetical protein B7Z60_01905 [Ferrovum sp. 37-45-19]|jgi:hypothetical protein|nr:MAG: hypothetical protein B7Z65_09540 [Ferrovum sp. 21-44-67]OYV95311.1 MAG: hypothetical protein B7Z60_01905 [Ferrovum sp. 37-45-19]OZB32764.1 MAG: hypothetical protein B7X47_05705 [Ferrovum sp. 34-44-207]HQT82400.1 hypothetical protein [Ferrovaceae bacterium]HQU07381.1 hypothetical protein [Ferrovaceae bacterium]
MTEVKPSQRFQIHYYFDDSTHSMNAFVRNRAEKDLLEAVKRVCELLDANIEIETEAYQEGGLIEQLFFFASAANILKYFSPAINDILKYHFTKSKTDDAIKEETLRGLLLDNDNKELEFQAKMVKVLEDRGVTRHVSNYYKKIKAYDKVTKVGFKNVTSGTAALVVDREKFKDFILIDDTTVIEDDDAFIEIISPVLKEGKFSWRGRYKNEKIDFSMGDAKFKAEVIAGQHHFANGFLITCLLQITITFDEFGDEKRKSYSVKKVYGTKELDIAEFKLRPLGIKRKWIRPKILCLVI